MATTEGLPPGIYRIAVANANSVELERHFLTNGEDYVTILPPGVGPGINQEVMHPINDELLCLFAHYQPF